MRQATQNGSNTSLRMFISHTAAARMASDARIRTTRSNVYGRDDGITVNCFNLKWFTVLFIIQNCVKKFELAVALLREGF